MAPEIIGAVVGLMYIVLMTLFFRFPRLWIVRWFGSLPGLRVAITPYEWRSVMHIRVVDDGSLLRTLVLQIFHVIVSVGSLVLSFWVLMQLMIAFLL
jgi:hypothetical protein